MSHTICKTEAPSVWQVVYKGKIDTAERKNAIAEWLRIARKTQIWGMLVNMCEAESSMGSSDEYELGKEIASKVEFQRTRIAFLHDPEKWNPNHFMETVEANRGLTTAVFTDRNAAMDWLLKGCERHLKDKPSNQPTSRIWQWFRFNK